MDDRVVLVRDKRVRSNLKLYSECYSIVLYRASGGLPSKLSLMVSQVDGRGEFRVPRSLAFVEFGQFEDFVRDVVDAYVAFGLNKLPQLNKQVLLQRLWHRLK